MNCLQDSAAATKAQFDKFIIDKAEEKEMFDKIYDKMCEDSLATASKQKASDDKALTDMSELQVAGEDWG